jgi:hypothetical protein
MLKEAGPEARQTAENQAGADGSIQMSDMITLNLTRLQLLALRTLVLDRYMSKEERNSTQEWVSVWEIPNQTVTIENLMILLSNDSSSDDGAKDLPAQDSNQDPEN